MRARAAGEILACGGCEMARARCHLERALAELEEARLAWGVWADGIRKVAELAAGVSVAEGFGLLDDPGYVLALRMGIPFDAAVDAAGAALAVAAGGGAAGFPGCPCQPVKAQIGSPHP